VPEEPELITAVTNAAALLESLGHEVVQAHPTALADRDFRLVFGDIVSNNVAAEVESIGQWRGKPVELSELEPRNRAMAEAGRRHTAVEHLLATQWIDGFRRRMAFWWDDFDLLLAPSLGIAPFKIGWIPPDDLTTSFGRTAMAVSFTSVFNATGQPSISLPLHTTPQGLPVGVQLVAAMGREDLLIRIASQVELAKPFTHSAMR
jgi:amidase